MKFRDKVNSPARWYWGIFSVLIAMSIYVLFGGYKDCGDNFFLYNRIWNMAECIKEGNMPWVYYKDLSGLGYGNSFFYPDLTLWLFVPLVLFGASAITVIRVYWMITIIAVFFACATFCKRFTKNYVEVATLFILSPIYMMSIITFNLPAQFLAEVFLLLFLAFAIDFFRDGKSFLPACITYFFVINTHLLSAFLAVVACAIFLGIYFKKTRWKEYLCFVGICGVLSVYVAMNVIYHSDFEMVVGNMPPFSDAIWYLNPNPIGHAFMFLIFKDAMSGLRLFELGTTIVMAGILGYRIQHKQFSKREVVFLLFMIPAIMFSTKDIYINTIDKYLPVPLLYPARYIHFIGLIVLLIMFRRIKKRVLLIAPLVLSIISAVGFFALIGNVTYREDTSEVYVESGVLFEDVFISGEYLKLTLDMSVNEAIELSKVVTDQNGVQYPWTQKEGVIRVAIPNDGQSRVLHFPKLYYRGYECVSYGKKLPITMTDDQLITSDIGTCGGEIILRYKHPIVLIIAWFVVVATEIALITVLIRRNKNVFKDLTKKLQKINPFKVF